MNTQKYPRYSVGIPVTRYDGRPVYWRSVNLSQGGLFVTGRPLFAPRTEMDIALWLPDRAEVVGRAKVVWTNDPERSDARSGLPAGMGLEFRQMEAHDRSSLCDYLLDLARRGRRTAKVGRKSQLGDYELLKRLGSGGMGEVFQARHRRLDHLVALKRLHPHLATDDSIVERLFDEARFVTQIRHENIVDVFDFVHDGQHTYYVMQFLEGESLGDVLDRGAIGEERTRYISAQLASALGAAHRHAIVHRDLKPDNVFLVRHGDDGDFVKLLDFGIAKLIDSSLRIGGPRTAAGVILGTPGYMSPEQLLGETATPKSDIYSLGVLMFEMITGRPPFQAEAWGELALMHTVRPPPKPSRIARGALSGALEALILACLQKEPRRRPASMEEVRARLINEAPAPAALSTPRPALPRRRRFGVLRFVMWTLLIFATSTAAAAGAVHLVRRWLALLAQR